MLFKERFWPGLRDGSLTVAYRRWRRPTVRRGGTLQSPGGLLGIDEVERVEEGDITEQDAVLAGYEGRKELVAQLNGEGVLYRIRFHRIGDDPRVALRQRTELTEQESSKIHRVLERNEWAAEYLRLIAERPGVVSTELAVLAGVDRPTFKVRVRQLKALGLTESLDVGYRLSPRGAAVLAQIG